MLNLIGIFEFRMQTRKRMTNPILAFVLVLLVSYDKG